MSDEASMLSGSIVKVAVIFLIGTIMLSGMVGGTNTVDSTTFHFTVQPHDGDTITADSYVFEFDSDNSVAAGHVPVTIGETLIDTSNNYRTAVGAYYSTA